MFRKDKLMLAGAAALALAACGPAPRSENPTGTAHQAEDEVLSAPRISREPQAVELAMFQMEAEAVNATSDKLENDTHAALEAIIEFQNVSIHSEVTSETALNAWGRVYQLERYVTRAQASVEAARATLNENSHSSREASDAQSALISALHRAELAITAAQGIQARYMAVDAAFRNAGGEFPDEPARHEWVEGHQN